MCIISLFLTIALLIIKTDKFLKYIYVKLYIKLCKKVYGLCYLMILIIVSDKYPR